MESNFERLAGRVARFPPRTLGALVFPGFQALDLWGPVEVFGDCAPAVQSVLVGVERGVHPSAQGPSAVAALGLDDPVRPDLLLVPGGDVTAHVRNEALLAWIRGRSADAELVMSVCNGAELLAAAGVLDGRRATTNKRLFRSIAAAYPGVAWVARARWVEDGRFVTASGVSAGIDMAFAVVARFAGADLADALATRIEYERHRDPGRDPFADLYDLDGGSGAGT